VFVCVCVCVGGRGGVCVCVCVCGCVRARTAVVVLVVPGTREAAAWQTQDTHVRTTSSMCTEHSAAAARQRTQQQRTVHVVDGLHDVVEVGVAQVRDDLHLRVRHRRGQPAEGRQACQQWWRGGGSTGRSAGRSASVCVGARPQQHSGRHKRHAAGSGARAACARRAATTAARLHTAAAHRARVTGRWQAGHVESRRRHWQRTRNSLCEPVGWRRCSHSDDALPRADDTATARARSHESH
jgi:hypothetical protein